MYAHVAMLETDVEGGADRAHALAAGVHDEGARRIGRDTKKGAPGDQVDPAFARRFAQPHFGFGIERHDRTFGKGDGRRLADAGAEMLRLCRAEARENAQIGGPSEREDQRSEEHTSELQSLMRISYAVFCLKKKKTQHR